MTGKGYKFRTRGTRSALLRGTMTRIVYQMINFSVMCPGGNYISA